MNFLFQDIRYVLRQLRRSPGFILTAVLTLALGIAATSAVFTLFDQVLLRMLPVENPKELVRFEWTGIFHGWASNFGGSSHNYFSYPMYRDLRNKNQVFSGVLAADRANVGVSWHTQSENEDAELVSGNYFQVLGVKPALGRLFTAQDDTEKNANPVVVLSYDYWKTRFAASPEIVGQTVLMNGHPFVVLGVAAEGFRSVIAGTRPGVFLPISMLDIAIPWMAPRDNLTNRQSIWLVLAARLKPGISAAQAEAGLAPLWHSLRVEEIALDKTSSERNRKRFLESKLELKDDSTGFSPDRPMLKKPLTILLSMAGLLMLICAINVATLLLLRAAGRAREMSMRYALGAQRGRIVTQLLIEGGMLGLGGAIAGLAMSPFVARILVRIMTNSDPGQEPYSSSVDVHVLLFTAAVAVLVSVLFSLAPILHFFRPDLANALRQNTGTFSKGSQRFRKLAVGVQILLGVVLLGGAGLFVRTVDHLRHQWIGFETDRLTTFSLDPSLSGYGGEQAVQIETNVMEKLRAIPGIASVAATDDAELTGNTNSSTFTVQGHQMTENEDMNFENPHITPGYFATLRQPLLAGREFTLADSKSAPKVAIVNLALARRFYGSPQNALGRMVAIGGGPDVVPDATIVGVVGDVKHTDLRTDPRATVYRPYAQLEQIWTPGGGQIYVRSSQAPKSVEAAIRQSVHAFDPTLVVDGLRTMEEQVSQQASTERALAVLALGFAVIAMLLAAVGFYGVLSYSTEQRTREIGVRLALGAQRWSVVSLIVREMAAIASVAILLALPAIVVLARLFRSQLYGVTTFDPLSLCTAVGLTAVIVVFAAMLPARRAVSVDPMDALRSE